MIGSLPINIINTRKDGAETEDRKINLVAGTKAILVLTFTSYLEWLIGNFNTLMQHLKTSYSEKVETRSDILQGQALFRGVKQLRMCLVILNILKNLAFHLLKKGGQKTKRQTDKKKKDKKRQKRKREKKKKRKKRKR